MGNFQQEFMLYDRWWISYQPFNSFKTQLDTTNEWVSTLVGAGTITYSNNLFPPHMILTNAGADNDSVELQRTSGVAGASPGDYINLIGGARAHYFETMIRFRDVNNDQLTVEQLDWFVGWAVADTTVLAGAVDFIGFSKVDQDADATNRIVLVSGDAGGAAGILRDQQITATGWTSNNPTGVLATDRAALVVGPNQWVRLAMSVIPAATGTNGGQVWARVNDTIVNANLTNVLPGFISGASLCTTLCVQNGEAVAKIMDVAYIFEAIAYAGI